MTARMPRFEIVRTEWGHHARFVAANGRIVWATENYERRVAAVRAIELICGNPVKRAPNHAGGGLEVVHETWGLLEVRDVQ